MDSASGQAMVTRRRQSRMGSRTPSHNLARSRKMGVRRAYRRLRLAVGNRQGGGFAVLTLASTSQGSPDRGDIAISYLVLCAAGTMESIVGLSVTMLVLATLVRSSHSAMASRVKR